ncbi:MAG: phosphotransferase [Rhodanobacteraceae bacterium]
MTEAAARSDPSTTPGGERTAARLAFARAALDDPTVALERASEDAWFRTYWRVASNDHSYIVMDAPTAQIDLVPFLRIGGILRDTGLRAPEVLAQDLDQGFLLLSDLGRATFLQAFETGADPEPLMDAAVDALVTLQKIEVPTWIPVYDAALLERELALFPDWYLERHLGTPLSDADRATWMDASARLVEAALAQPRVFVHRDYMPRNLMPGTPDAGDIGILDFQDAVLGPIAYDPVCLVKDAFWSWPSGQADAWLRRYWNKARAAALPVREWQTFRRDADWIGMQRHLKVIGIFARLYHRDDKRHYVADVPRFFAYLFDVLPRYPEFRCLEQLLRRHSAAGSGLS